MVRWAFFKRIGSIFNTTFLPIWACGEGRWEVWLCGLKLLLTPFFWYSVLSVPVSSTDFFFSLATHTLKFSFPKLGLEEHLHLLAYDMSILRNYLEPAKMINFGTNLHNTVK